MNEKSPFPAILEISFFYTRLVCLTLRAHFEPKVPTFKRLNLFHFDFSLKVHFFFVEYLESIRMVSADKNGTKCHPVQRPRVH